MIGLTIGKLARRAAVGVETIRFYERKRLLARPRRPERGFRTYPDDAVQRIRFIRQAQDLGFTLREIHHLLSLRANPHVECTKVFERASNKLQDVVSKIERLQTIRHALETVLAACPRHGMVRSCSILEAIEHPPGRGKTDRADGPAILSPRRKPPMKTITLNIAGMHCDACAKTVQSALLAEPGVTKAHVTFKARSAHVVFDPKRATREQFVGIVERVGFRVADAGE